MSGDVIEQMFDKDSFKEEITSASEAQAAVSYFSHNLRNFREKLTSEGKSYEEVQDAVRQCWVNLIQSSQRVGYTSGHLERMAKLFQIGVNKALPKKTNK